MDAEGVMRRVEEVLARPGWAVRCLGAQRRSPAVWQAVVSIGEVDAEPRIEWVFVDDRTGDLVADPTSCGPTGCP